MGDFIAKRTIHIPPKYKHLIRYYGIYSSRTKGKAAKVGSLEKFGYTAAPTKKPVHASDFEMKTVSNKVSWQSWARLIQKVYEVDPLVCEKCGQEISKTPVVGVIAIITDPYEGNKILECLKRNNAPPLC